MAGSLRLCHSMAVAAAEAVEGEGVQVHNEVYAVVDSVGAAEMVGYCRICESTARLQTQAPATL